MSRYFSKDDQKPLLVAALIVSIVAFACAFGCASTATTQRKTFTTISDVDAGVKAAMGAFNVRYQQGLQTEAQRAQVLDAYAKYQKAAIVAVSVGRDLGQNANALQIGVDAARPLLDLIASFLPQPKGP